MRWQATRPTRCGRVRGTGPMVLLACAALVAVLALAGCDGGGPGSAAGGGEGGGRGGASQTGQDTSQDSSTTEASASDLVLNPTEGTPLACVCDKDCEDDQCAVAQRAFGMGLYPWLTYEMVARDTSAYRVFLGLHDAQYKVIAEGITDRPVSVGFSSAFLSNLYHGPQAGFDSSMEFSTQHFYEAIIMKWLSYEDGVPEPVKMPDRVMSGASVALDLASETERLEEEFDEVYSEFLAKWEKLTGEPFDSPPVKSLGYAQKFAGAASKVTDVYSLASGLIESWSNVSAVCGADFDKIELLERAALTSDNKDFVAAARRIVSAYKAAVDDDETIDWDLASLATDQALKPVVETTMSATLAASNPFIAAGLSLSDLVFNAKESADANMSILGVDIVGAELRQALTGSLSDATGDIEALAEGTPTTSAAPYIRSFKAYLGFEMFAIDESSGWAKAVSSQPFGNEEGAQAIMDAAAQEKETRRALLDSVSKLESNFWELEGAALCGSCSCSACGASPAASLEGTYRRVGDTEQSVGEWSHFEVAPTDGGLSFSHEALIGNRMLSLTNHQPVEVSFEDGVGSVSVQSLDFGDLELTFTLGDDGTFTLSCGIEELDGTYVPADTPLSEEESQAQQEAAEETEADIRAWITEGDGVWFRTDTSEKGPGYLAFSEDGTISRWLYGPGGIEGSGTYSLEGNTLTMSFSLMGGKPYGEATYTVRLFTTDEGKQIRLDEVSNSSPNDFDGWYEPGDVWW